MEGFAEYSRFVVTLLAILSPFSALPVFLALTAGQEPSFRARTADMAASTVFLVLLLSALTGDMLPAERLYQYGLLNALVEPGEALAEARRLARRIIANAPLAVAASKRIIGEQRDWPTDRMFELQDPIFAPVFASRDAREGAAAFAQKRPPRWTGE